jgi:hypothetical protein
MKSVRPLQRRYTIDEERADRHRPRAGRLRAVLGQARRAALAEHAAHRDDFDVDDEPGSARRRAHTQGSAPRRCHVGRTDEERPSVVSAVRF